MPPLRWEFIKEKRKEKKRHRPRKKTSFKKNRTKRRYRSPYQKGFKEKSKKTAIDQANVKVFEKNTRNHAIGKVLGLKNMEDMTKE